MNRSTTFNKLELVRWMTLKRKTVKIAQEFSLSDLDIVAFFDQHIEELKPKEPDYLSANADFDITRLRQIIETSKVLIDGRIAAGFSQSAMARMLELKRQQFHSYEKTEYSHVRLARVIEIAQLLESRIQKRLD